MNILGINGLGVSPSACIVRDGELLAMIEEEKINRIKGFSGALPQKAVKFCLDHAKIKLNDVDFIAFSWDANLYRYLMPYFFAVTYFKYAQKSFGLSNVSGGFEQLIKYHPLNVVNELKKMFFSLGWRDKLPRVVFIPHHISHAAASFYISGLEEAYILIVDGSGEYKCTSVLKGKGLDINEVLSFKIPHSLGWFYQGVTEFLGFIPNRHEGKTMALASYGVKNEEIENKFSKVIRLHERGSYRYDARYSFLGVHSFGKIYSDKMVELFGMPRRHNKDISERDKSLAYYAQSILEEAVSGIVKDISKRDDYKGNICIAGGVGLNCKMNGALAALDCVDNIFVPPFPNDSGSALGAALYLSKKIGFNPRRKMEHAYWGPGFHEHEIERAIRLSGLKFRKDLEIEKTAARLIAEDKIVGWFQGRLEAGPRALGARSILANPLRKWVSQHVNDKVKHREVWRPFAPAILFEDRDDYIKNSKDSPFMALSFTVSDRVREIIPAVIHVDNSTRPQFVKKDVSSRFWKLINEFKQISGVPVVLNTSFNDNEEPIVSSPAEAIKTFNSSGMDYLVMGDFIISK